MGDENPICTLGDYSKPSHKGYRNNIELPIGNNGVPLQSDTIRLMQNGCSFHKLRSENPNQHLKDFLKLVDSLDLDGANRERTCLHPRDFAKPVKAISLPQDVPSASDHHLIKLKNLVQRLMEAHIAPMQPIQVNDITSLSEICSGPHDTQYCMENPEQVFVKYASSHNNEVAKLERTLREFDSHQEKRLSNLGAQLGQQQDDMINKINTLWKVFSEKFDDTSTRDTAENPMTQMNFVSTNYPTKEELRGKEIKSPSKLLSLKYLSQSSLAEQNRNPLSLKRVHFVNSIIILNKEDEAKEERSVKPNATKYKDHKMTIKEEEEVKSKEEFEEETKEETKEEEEGNLEHFDTFPIINELRYHEWLLKNPRPPWVKAKIRTGNLNNMKFSCMTGHFDKKQTYLDMESPINVMSRLHYNWIMINRLYPRRKPSNPKKICNFIGRVKGLKVFFRNFTYECDFVVLEDTNSVIDHDLGSMIFGKPFVEMIELVYDMKEGTVVFEKDKEKNHV
ncbi:hypothetical protein Tco_0871447 [Tanacetum coccineum]